MRMIAMTALAALIAATPAAAKTNAQDAAVPTATSSQEVKGDGGETKVCKSLKTSGTRMFRRVCLTQEQWAKVAEESK